MSSLISEQERVVARVQEAVRAIQEKGMVIMVDDEDRENEGDLVLAAELCTAEHVNFMAKEARGLICLTLEPSLVDRLELPMMGDSSKKLPSQGTAFTVSIEARQGVTTGISAADRAKTIQVAIADETKPEDIVVPGHIFPLKARAGGVLERAGHTEGSVDLSKIAGFKGAGVICEIMNDDGSMARMPDLELFSKKHSIPIVAIADLIHYRLLKDSFVKLVVEKKIATRYGNFEAKVFESLIDGSQHLALVKGTDFSSDIVDVRVHSQRSLVDSLGDPQKSGFRIDYGLRLLKDSDKAVLLILAGKQVDFVEQLGVLASDIENSSESPLRPGMDLRLHGLGAQILRSLDVRQMRLHNSSKISVKGLSGFGLEIVDTKLMK